MKVKWGRFKIGSLFDKVKTTKLPFKTHDLPKRPSGEYVLPVLTSSFQNQGLNYYAPEKGATKLKNVISIPSNSDVYRAYFQSREFSVLSDAYAIRWRNPSHHLSNNQYLFMLMCINKAINLSIYSHKNKLGGWNTVKGKEILLPLTDEGIDFNFMEDFISTLMLERVETINAFLKKKTINTISSKEDGESLIAISNVHWQRFKLKELFGPSHRGKRLKSADRVSGDLPFITAGETDEGVSSFIGNNVEIFPENTTTIDMFGSAKYRSFSYGADDHITIVHTEHLDKHAAIFMSSAINKSSHNGQFDYGRNFYPKDADNLEVLLPTKCNAPDYSFMSLFVKNIENLVIKELISYLHQLNHFM